MSYRPIEDALSDLLFRKFKMRYSAGGLTVIKRGREFSSGFWAYDEGERNDVYMVSINDASIYASDPGDLDRFLDHIEQFPKFHSHFRHHSVYGMVATVLLPDGFREEILNRGLYLVRIRDEKVRLQIPRDFQPTDYGLPARRLENKKRGGQ